MFRFVEASFGAILPLLQLDSVVLGDDALDSGFRRNDGVAAVRWGPGPLRICYVLPP